jgi:hypothetical protein
MAGSRLDVLTGDGESIFLRHQRFDNELGIQSERKRHLFSTGTLDDAHENHRSHWIYGYGEFSRLTVAYSWIANKPDGNFKSQLAEPYGLMLAFDANQIWGVRRWSRKGIPRERDNLEELGGYMFFNEPNQPKSDGKKLDFRSQEDPEAAITWAWNHELDFRPHAMIRAGNQVVLAGMPALISIDNEFVNIADFEGEGPGVLEVRSAEDGQSISLLKLDAAPRWDGMATTGGHLYIAGQDGSVRCYGAAR